MEYLKNRESRSITFENLDFGSHEIHIHVRVVELWDIRFTLQNFQCEIRRCEMSLEQLHVCDNGASVHSAVNENLAIDRDGNCT